MTDTDFKRRMDRRLDRWYQNADPHPDPEVQARRRYVAGLANKSAMLKYAERMNLPIPERYAEAATVGDLDFTALPASRRMTGSTAVRSGSARRRKKTGSESRTWSGSWPARTARWPKPQRCWFCNGEIGVEDL